MSTVALLSSLFQHKAWADAALLAEFGSLDPEVPEPSRTSVLRLLDHISIVDRVFMAHLRNEAHGFEANEVDEPASLEDLSDRIPATDRWYVAYLSGSSPSDLEETIRFRFTDGAPGRMSRAEMLAHVVTHGGYHRGEIGRLLPQLYRASSRDVFAGYLHRQDPARRL